jgi:hypothetical protein
MPSAGPSSMRCTREIDSPGRIDARMKIEEHCREAEVRLQEVQIRLAEPSAEQMAVCEAELHAIIRSLPDPRTPLALDDRDRALLQRLKRMIRQVSLRVEHGTRLCQGWAQLRNSAGYTNQGRPVLASFESKASFEA